MIPDSVIEEIKFRNDIEDVVSSYVTLKRGGSNAIGLCPFHSEKTPSFTVFRSSGNFYCFGCGAGGDVITFIMKAENLDYPSALEFLAKRAGIEIPRERSPEDGKGAPSKTRVIDMNREAARFFYSCLLDTERNPAGMKYFMKRGITMPYIRHFGLGYAPDSWDSLTGYLTGKGFSEDEICAGFLGARSQKTRKLYDVFRNRVMIPIIDLTGNIVAFGGRVLDDSQPKYLNSSDTPAFKKSKNLFALNFAKDACSDRLILCEGYMDVIALHMYGFTNSVATLGTAITPEHARIMKRYTKEVLISYDSDAAGQKAADKAFRLLSDAGVDARILKMDGAKDPDEFVRKFGTEKFKEVLDGSRTEFEFKMSNILSKYDISKGDDKIKAASELSDLIATFYSAVEREVYISAAANALSISADSIRADVGRAQKKNAKKFREEEKKKVFGMTGGYGDRVNPDYVKHPAAAAAEEAILGIMLLHPEEIRRVSDRSLISEEDFVTDFNKRVFTAIKENCDENGSFNEGALGATFGTDEMGRIIGMKVRRASLSDNTSDVLDSLISRLKSAAGSGNTVEDIESILGRKRDGAGGNRK